jgi:hypothetical protein
MRSSAHLDEGPASIAWDRGPTFGCRNRLCPASCGVASRPLRSNRLFVPVPCHLAAGFAGVDGRPGVHPRHYRSGAAIDLKSRRARRRASEYFPGSRIGSTPKCGRSRQLARSTTPPLRSANCLIRPNRQRRIGDAVDPPHQSATIHGPAAHAADDHQCVTRAPGGSTSHLRLLQWTAAPPLLRGR